MNILVVADDVSSASDITEEIKGADHQVEMSETGAEALNKVRQTDYDLVVVDVSSPDYKGWKLIPRLKEIRPYIGIVAVTDYNSPELESKVRLQGILLYLIRPYDIEDLKVLVDHISQKRGQKSRY